MLDFGYPQNSEADTLKMYITTESVKSERAVMEDSAKITIQATGATSWRRSDVKYRKNEAFIDVIESVNLLLSAQGNVLRADVAGQIMMRAYLSGTPECKFGLNDKVLLEKDPSNRRYMQRLPVDWQRPSLAFFPQLIKCTLFLTISKGTFHVLLNNHIFFFLHPTVSLTSIGKHPTLSRLTTASSTNASNSENSTVIALSALYLLMASLSS